MLTGYSDNLPSDVLLDTGIIMVGTTKIGATRGAPVFENGREIEQVPFDGQHAPIYKLDRLFHGEPKVSGTAIEFGDSATGNQIGKLEPGSASASAGTPNITTITPKTGGTFLGASDYLSDVRWIFERGIGTGTKQYACIYFPKALIKTYSVQGQNKDTALIPFEIVGRKDMASGTTADPAYKIELREALPA